MLLSAMMVAISSRQVSVAMTLGSPLQIAETCVPDSLFRLPFYPDFPDRKQNREWL
jgi:hypothetical protein